ncbi:MAG: hypothetical protein K6E47_17535 [Lachnospiraceae bacterium]|nr:hypothetical protein [Lachnospiraceae bacterium]
MKFRYNAVRSIAVLLVCTLIVNTTGCASDPTVEETNVVEPNVVEATEQITPEPVTPIPTEISSQPTSKPLDLDFLLSDDASLGTWDDWRNNLQETTSSPTPVPTSEITPTSGVTDSGEIYMNSPISTVECQPYTYCGKAGAYYGDWRGDRPEGNGCFTVSENEYYDGQWDCGYINGDATIVKPWEDYGYIVYSGQCTIDTITGNGYIQLVPDEEKTGDLEIYGDFNDESSLVYYSFDDEGFFDDVGYVYEGELISYLDDLDKLDYKMEVCLPKMERSYFIVEDDYLYEPAESPSVVEGIYGGDVDAEGKPNGYGIFVYSNKKPNNYPIMVNGEKKIVDWRDCKLFIGVWQDGVLTGNYIYESRSVPVDKQYFDDEHSTFKQYVYKNGDKLEKTMTYVDTFITNVETREITDTLKVIEVDYLDRVPFDDGMTSYRGSDEVYRGDRVEWQYYFRHDFKRWDALYTKGMYTKSEVYKTYSKIAPRFWDKNVYYDGYRAFYNEDQEMIKYNKYDWDHPEGYTVPKQSHLSLGEIILGGAVLFIGGLALYKLLSTSSKGKTTEASEKYLNEKRAEIQADVQSYNERLKKADELDRKADELESLISSATYLSESQIYAYKQEINELRREANHTRPSIW